MFYLFKTTKQNLLHKKTDVYHFDDVWSLDIFDLKDYGPESNRGYKNVLLVTKNFSKYGWKCPLKHKNSQPVKKPF